MRTGICIRETCGKIDWGAVAEASPDFLMIRGTCGAMTRELGNRCEEREIPWGICLDWGTEMQEPTEAEEVLTEKQKRVSAFLEDMRPQEPIVLGLYDAREFMTLSAQEKGNLAGRFCEEVQSMGCAAGICANKYWFTHVLTDPVFDRFDRWVIQQYRECTYTGTYRWWQYTSLGYMPGIPEPVERMVDERHPRPNPKGEELPDLTGYSGTSVAGALNRCGWRADLCERAALAAKTGVVKELQEYRGTAEQNRRLLLALGGRVNTSRILREGVHVKLKLGSRNILTDRPFGDEYYRNTYQILSVSGVSVYLGIDGNVIGKVNRNSVLIV